MKANACARFGRDPCALLIVVLAGLGTAHILVRTASYGAAIDGDSVFFLSTAMNFLAGEGWLNARGTPLVWWPPLFPLLLVALGWVGIEPLEAGRWINAAAFGLTILAAGLYLRSNLRSQVLAATAIIVIAASLPLNELAGCFMTEPLFVLWTLLALIQLAAFLNRGERTALLWTAGLTALAALTRYPGVVLTGTGVLLLLARRAPPLATRLKQAIVFGAVSALPLLAVLAYNWAVSDTLTGARPGSGQSPFDGLSPVADIFRAWAIPPNAPDGFGSLLGMVAGLVMLAAGAVVVLDWSRLRHEWHGLGPALPFGVFAVAYLVFTVAIVPLVTPLKFPLPRYLLPVYVPLLLAGVFLLDRLLSIEAAGWMRAVRYGLASLVVLAALAHVSFSVDRNIHITRQAWTVGYRQWTYNSKYWEGNEILNYIQDASIDGPVYSNNLNLAWFWDRTAAPGKHRRLPAEIQNLTSIILWWSDGYTPYIQWIRKENRDHVYDFNDFDLRLLPGVEVVAELADGMVFRVTAAEPFDPDRHHARKQRYVQQLIQQAGEPVIYANSTWPISTWGAERAGTDEQVIRAGWDVYRNGRTLTYRKQPCTPDDGQTNFVLQVRPDYLADLSADSGPYGFDNLDFNFRTHGGIRLDDQCVATAQLPDYPISRIYIGRWMDGNNRSLWEMKAKPFAGERHRARTQRYVDQLIEQADEQVIRAGWTVYRTGRHLLYRKEPCVPADVQAKLVLHIIPTDLNDLPADRKEHGYDSLGFYFNQRGFRLDDQCIAIAQLPDYAIGRIRVGQWISKEDRTVWEAELLEIGK